MLSLFEICCRLGVGLALVTGWLVIADLMFGALIVLTDLDFSPSSRLGRAAEYALIVTIIVAAGTILLGGVVGVWQAFNAVAADTISVK